MAGSREREREMDEQEEDTLFCEMLRGLCWYIVTGTQDEPCSIHRVPPNIREGDPASYEPQILSIGPYHYRNHTLQAMNDHKWRYLHNLLLRKHHNHYTQAVKECIDLRTDLHGFLRKHHNHYTQAVKECIKVVRGSEEKARSYYSEPVYLGTVDFVKMMVLDGCFIVELLLRFHEQIEEDPILTGWMFNVVRRDIIKLENQIPFFILEELFDLAVGPGATHPSLRQHAFYYLMLRRADETPLPEHKIYHLLHFYDVILLPKSPNTSTNTRPSSSFTVQSVLKKMCRFTSCSFTLPTWRKPKPTSKLPQFTIPCVVKLEEMGIKLRRKPAESFLDDVTFQDGTLSIPPLSIDDNTNSVFRNLVALEQCRPDVGRHFTQYVVFLDCIVNTPQDVSILQNRGIVEYRLGSEEEVAKLINLLGKDITIDPTNEKLVKLFRDVNQHCQSRWHKHRARFMRDYFSSPWSTISLVAAVFLLLMTAAQVVLAVLSYKKQ